MRDLFLALQEERNQRGHPLLAGLLYAFCPRAARWWTAGADPELPTDPIWLALEDMAAGLSLGRALKQHGLASLVDSAKEYVKTARRYRRNHPDIAAPEATAFFDEVRGRPVPVEGKLRLKKAEQFGGWSGYYEYLRTYAFLFEDWTDALNMPNTATVHKIRLSLRVKYGNKTVQPVSWPTWMWTSRGPREVVTALAFEGNQDYLRFSLFADADRRDGKWKGRPEIWVLHQNGEAQAYQPALSAKGVRTLLEWADTLVHRGPYLPVGAMTAPHRCGACGFRTYCWEDDAMTEFRDEFVVNDFRGSDT